MSVEKAPPPAHHEEELKIDTTGMSEGKREALEVTEAARETDWHHPSFVGEIFLGRLRLDLVNPFPAGQVSEKGERFLADIERFLAENVDPQMIDETGEIPDHVIEGLAKLGAFGIKIPTEYGGLGLPQMYYTKTAFRLGSYCGNLSALLSAHQSIGVPVPLLMFGTEEQKKRYLPRVAKGEISAFALTEDGVGSDPARMATTAEPTPDGKHFIINGKKLWCTNGTRAGLLVVMAKTPPKIVRGKPRNQISAFIVDTKAPGVTITHRCRFMGLKALYNAVIEFKDVKVPREDMVAAEGKGLRVALSTLNTGRLTLPAMCAGGGKRCLEMAREWANRREQWGAAVGKHAAVADKIARIAAETFAIEAMVLLTSGMVDRKHHDIRLEAAMCKMWGSERGWQIIDETLQIIGGRGFETEASLRARGETPYATERMMRDSRINRIFEGSSEIMRLFIAREALDPHLKRAGDAVNSKVPMGKRIAAALKAATFYAWWLPSRYIPISGVSTQGLDARLAKHARTAGRLSRKLSRRLFLQMLKHGPKLEREQVLLGRFVDIATEIFAIAATSIYAQYRIDSGAPREEILELADFFCDEAKLRIERHFAGVGKNNDSDGYKLAQRILGGDFAFLEREAVRIQK